VGRQRLCIELEPPVGRKRNHHSAAVRADVVGHVEGRDFDARSLEVAEAQCQRWAIDICGRNSKQLLGFVNSSARQQAAVERTAPFVGLACSLLVSWALRGTHRLSVARPPLRPWYRSKRGLVFSDVPRAAQRTLIQVDQLAQSSARENPRKLSSPERLRGAKCLEREA
jgi:hypothetical protein